MRKLFDLLTGRDYQRRLAEANERMATALESIAWALNENMPAQLRDIAANMPPAGRR